MMIDSVNSKFDNKIRLKVRALFMTGSEYQKNNYLIEDPVFVDSSYRHLSQLVDCIAYCVRRNYRFKETDSKEKETYGEWLNQIRDKFVGGPTQFEKYGIKEFPK